MLDPGARVQAVAAAVRVYESTNSDLSVVGGNLTGQRDRDEVLQSVHHSALQLFQQDNASSHTARVVQAFLNQEHIQTLPWRHLVPVCLLLNMPETCPLFIRSSHKQ